MATTVTTTTTAMISTTTTTRPSALGMSDPVMEFLEFYEKGKIFWVKGKRF